MKLNYKQFSTGGAPLIILHGLFGNLRNWNWHARELAGDFSVYVLDLRNHGDSPHADSMNYPEMAADLLEFLDDRQLGEANLLGHSMGGKVAMQLALSEPGRVSRLLVADIAPVPYQQSRGDHENVFSGLLSIDLASLSSRNDAELALTPFVVEEGVRKFLVSNLVKGEGDGFQWRFNLPALRDNYDRLREGVRTDRTFGKPVLFVKGAWSHYIKQDDWPTIQRLFPAARIKTVMGAGHWLHAEKPQVFFKLARDFFSQAGSPDSGKDRMQ